MPNVKSPVKDTFYFEGFPEPNTHQTPNILIDWVLGHPDVVSDTELRVLLYLSRRICGFGKEHDAVSFNQFLHGIRKRDGGVVDYGCGLKSRSHLNEALRSLEDKGFITSERQADERGGKTATVYRLRFWQPPRDDGSEIILNRRPAREDRLHERSGGSAQRAPGGSAHSAPGVVPNGHLQSKEEQYKDFESSNARRAAHAVDNSDKREGQASDAPAQRIDARHQPRRTLQSSEEERQPANRRAASDPVPKRSVPARGGDPEAIAAVLSKLPVHRSPADSDARLTIRSYIAEFAAEFGDQAPLKSSVTRAYNLYRQSGRSLEAFIDQLYRSRGAVRERTTVAATSPDERKAPPIHNRMSYFFGVLADDLGLSPPSAVKEGARAAP